MVRKCSVGGCNTNYASTLGSGAPKLTIYGFPSNSDDRAKWLASLPNKIDKVTEHMGVCVKHFAPDVPMVRRGRHMVPNVPPSIFPNVPTSCIPTPQPQSRPTTKSSSEVRARTLDVDEMCAFRELDSFGLRSDFMSAVQARYSSKRVFLSEDQDDLLMLSKDRKGLIHNFSMYSVISVDMDSGRVTKLNCELYINLKCVSHPSFTKGEIQCWSQLDEVVRFLCEPGTNISNKEDFLLRQIHLLNSPRNAKLYTTQDLCLALSWRTRSRSLYAELRNFLHLPSLSTLARVTRTAKNTDDDTLYKNVFNGLCDRAKACILIIDEIYVKASVVYRGGFMFGYAADEQDKLAKTLLCVMVKCMFGGPKFIAKIIPCAALKSSFQFDVVKNVISTLERCGGKVLAALNDNNKLNQSFFRMFTPMQAETPWIVKAPTDNEHPMFLFYDTVHLIKNLRNNWITEATKTLKFPTPQGEILAKWSDLEELHRSERENMGKLSKLTSSSIAPTNIEKQKVSLALDVFSNETSSALKTSVHRIPSWQATALFIDAVVKLWKLLNCKSRLQSCRRNDPDRIALDSSDAGVRGFQTLTAWASIADMMKQKKGTRMHALTKDTADALAWTCRCLQSLAKYLLNANIPEQHEYVCLGFFQQDDLERHFGYFRMSAGCNYYLTVQEVINTHTMDQARLMLKHVPDVDIYAHNVHQCDLCHKALTDAELLLLDDMSEGTVTVSDDEKQAIFYIAGYIASKHAELSGSPSETSPNVQSFLADLNRGGLTYPSNQLYSLTLLAYIFVKSSSERFCRKRLITVVEKFPGIFLLDLTISSHAVRRLSNVLMKRYSKHNTQEYTTPTTQRKVAKLTSQSS